MLLNLHVKNLALIDELEIDFHDNLNILTGETGAGKSILIDSINGALGGRLTKDMLRDPEKDALVELLFQMKDDTVDRVLEQEGIGRMDDRQVLLSRKITSGRSVSRINGETVTAAKVKEIAAYLIDIHGQHEHQSLLYPSRHLEILDRFAGKEVSEIKAELEEEYRRYTEYRDQLSEESADEKERLRQKDFLDYEIAEIEQARLQPGEEEELERRYRRMANGRDIAEGLNEIHDALDEGSGAGGQISRAVRTYYSIADLDDALGSIGEQLSTIESLANDLNREIAGYMDDLTFDPSELYETERRLDAIRGVTAKYGGTVREALEQLERKKKEREKLEHYEEYLEKLQKDHAEARRKVLAVCARLTDARKRASAELVDKIRSALSDLNFLDVRFCMEFQEKKEPTANGMDDAAFYITTNPGMPLRPLKDVASGGELSRIMLAIKSVLADVDNVETLIFDEIDTGISGRTAQKVSEKLNVISRSHQVLCITHLAQIAAMADHHFLIEKKTKDGATRTEIQLLSQEESVLELARITGGVTITDTVVQNAREMKHLAGRAKLD